MTMLAKALNAPPEKWHGLQDVEIRYRQRYVDLLANAEVRRVFAIRTKIVTAFRALPRRPRLPRGRDADPAAALRRRRGAPLHHLPQRAGPDLLPADRRRALPEAAARRRVRARLRDLQGLPERGDRQQPLARVHDARVLRGLRRLRDDDGDGRAVDRRTVALQVFGGPSSPTGQRDRRHPALARARPCARRSSTAPGSTMPRTPTSRPAGGGPRRRRRRRERAPSGRGSSTSCSSSSCGRT